MDNENLIEAQQQIINNLTKEINNLRNQNMVIENSRQHLLNLNESRQQKAEDDWNSSEKHVILSVELPVKLYVLGTILKALDSQVNDECDLVVDIVDNWGHLGVIKPQDTL